MSQVICTGRILIWVWCCLSCVLIGGNLSGSNLVLLIFGRSWAQGLSLTMTPTKTASLLWKFSPLGIFWVFLRKVFKIRLHVHYMRSKDCDGSRFFRGAFMGGNNFVFNPEANSLLFREFLPWLKQHHCMMTRKLRKSNNSLTFITDHDENSFNQQQQ